MLFKKDEVVFLLGAGASVEAGIPASRNMIDSLEELLKNDSWKKYTSLYHYMKSSIIYADGIKGRFEYDNFNIEKLVNTLDEILKSDEHPLFPFIGSWTPKLPEVAGNDLNLLKDFRKDIIRQLRDKWIQLERNDNAKYYTGLSRFQKEYEFPLRVFSLNYDMCVEIACAESGVERGFGDDTRWDWRVFDNEQEIESNIFLYKLHGSIDWVRNTNGELTYKDSTSRIELDSLEIIFGTTYKLQYVDPFLFLSYEFRKRTLSDAKLIIAVGYGFADDHINGIIGQSLNSSDNKKLLAVGLFDDETSECGRIKAKLAVAKEDKIVCWGIGAKEFFETSLSIENISKVFPEEAPPFQEVQ
ncbi:MAG: hypothetical protein BWY28_01211 [bacterium ADurb.Bin236]|nr:MAG: hypothetical protein BWY28_01211 [bacterium ADurb.Bin236]